MSEKKRRDLASSSLQRNRKTRLDLDRSLPYGWTRLNAYIKIRRHMQIPETLPLWNKWKEGWEMGIK